MERAEGEGRLRSAAAALAVLAIACGHADETPAGPGAATAPTAVELYARGTELAHDRRDLPGAIRAFREAITADPGMAEAHFGLGLALLDTGDAEGAAAEIESALSLAPPDVAWRQDAENALVLAYLHKAKDEAR